MRVQTVINVGHPVHGGAQMTHRTWLRLLARHFGHDCTYVDASPVAVRPRRGEIAERVFRDLDELAAITRAARPDVAILAFDVVHRALPLMRRLGVPVVAALNSFEYCPPTRAEIARWQLAFERPYPTERERRRVFDGAAAVIVNSEFLRRRLLARTGVRATVVHPAFDPDEILVPGHDAAAAPYVTGVCGHPHKGAAIFHELAVALPDVEFLVAGPVHHAWVERFRACPNLRHLPFSPPREVLAASRVVLVPSQWAEPFGRIAIEAMANGIPVLASRTGGLAEIVGDSALGVARFRDAGVWRRRLERPLAERLGDALNTRVRVTLGASKGQIIIDFATVLPGVQKARVKSRIILTPEHAKRLLRSLQENIVRYESNVGKIEIPSPQPTPDAGPKMGQA